MEKKELIGRGHQVLVDFKRILLYFRKNSIRIFVVLLFLLTLIFAFKDQNPDASFAVLSEVAVALFGVKLSRSAAHAIFHNREKFENVSQGHMQSCRRKYPQEAQLEMEVYEEILRQNSLTNSTMSPGNIRALAQEFSRHLKYGDFFKNHRFGQTWVRTFRKAFGVWLTIIVHIQFVNIQK